MLELLLYCHMFAKLRYAGEIAAITDGVMDFIGRTKARHGLWDGLLPAPVRRRREAAFGFGFWSEQDLMQSLDRLDAYVGSVA
jgi:hypothetical protein